MQTLVGPEHGTIELLQATYKYLLLTLLYLRHLRHKTNKSSQGIEDRQLGSLILLEKR